MSLVGTRPSTLDEWESMNHIIEPGLHKRFSGGRKKMTTVRKKITTVR